jgi:Uma2 family endonuclease
MNEPARKLSATYPEYLAQEQASETKHERRIPSLREYVLVSQRKPRIEVFRRNEDGNWTLFEAEASGSVKLASIGCELSVDEVYANALGAAV